MTIHLLQFVTTLFVMYAYFKILSVLEKKFISPKLEKGTVVETWSLKFFMVSRLLSCGIGAAELDFSHIAITKATPIFVFLIAIGVILRIISIATLRIYWSYHIEIRESHPVIETGVYRYMHHPAYLGNVFIPSTFAALGLNIASVFSLVSIVVFYLYRSTREDALLRGRSLSVPQVNNL